MRSKPSVAFKMKSKTYNGQARSGEKDFETLQLGAFATPGLLLAQGPEGLTAESRLNKPKWRPMSEARLSWAQGIG